MASGLLQKSPVSSSLCDEVPSHIYSKIASRAQRIFDQQCKKTFATISASNRHRASARTAIKVDNDKSPLGKSRTDFWSKAKNRVFKTFPSR
jgi:hypothetical protein